MKNRILLFLLFYISIVQIAGQDIHFSQFSASAILENPALTGFFDDKLRAGLIYRNQGASVSTPYQTYSAMFDGVIQPGFLHDNWFGAGCALYNDRAGNGMLQKTSVLLTTAFHKGLNRFGTLNGSIGVSLSVVNRSVDYDKLVFGNQWNGTQFDPGLSSNEPYTSSSFLYMDLNVGILLSYKPDRTSVIFGGVSLNHINKPGETFYDGTDRLGWKWIAHGNANLQLNDQWYLKSGVEFILMNGLTELMFGGNLHYGKSDLRLCSGLWYRFNRDLIPMIGLDYQRYSLLFSYDINVSRLNKASNFQGGFEVSLQKTFSIKSKGYRCDNFRFY